MASTESTVSYSSYRIVLAIAAAAIAACFFTIITATADQVEASALVSSDFRSDGRAVGPQCSQRAWPYYEAHCLRDRRPRTAQTKSFRIVTTERQ